MDTTSPFFNRYIKQKIKKKDKYAKVAFGSSVDEEFKSARKPGGTLIGMSGKWGSKVERTGCNPMGR